MDALTPTISSNHSIRPKLLEILRSLKPEASAEIEKRNEELSHEKLSSSRPNKKALPFAIFSEEKGHFNRLLTCRLRRRS